MTGTLGSSGMLNRLPSGVRSYLQIQGRVEKLRGRSQARGRGRKEATERDLGRENKQRDLQKGRVRIQELEPQLTAKEQWVPEKENSVSRVRSKRVGTRLATQLFQPSCMYLGLACVPSFAHPIPTWDMLSRSWVVSAVPRSHRF